MVWFVILLLLFAQFVVGGGVFWLAARLFRCRASFGRCTLTFLILLAIGLVLALLSAILDIRPAFQLLLAGGELVLVVWLTGRLLGMSIWRTLGALVLYAAVMFGCAMLIKTFAVEAYAIPTGSMAPTLLAGDRITADKLTPRLLPVQRGDVVVYKWLGKPESILGPGPQNHVKRLVGLPGDRVELREDKVYVNGQFVGKDMRHDLPNAEPFFEGLIPPGKMYVVGDNLEASLDSRTFGLLDLSAIIGKATLIYASRVPAVLRQPPPPWFVNQPPADTPGRIRWERICMIVR